MTAKITSAEMDFGYTITNKGPPEFAMNSTKVNIDLQINLTDICLTLPHTHTRFSKQSYIL